MANQAGMDDNSRRALSALSSANDGSVINLWADPVTHRLLVDNANSSSGLTVGSTTIASGTTTRVLFDNAGILGEYIISGTGNVAMTTSPAFTTPNLGTPSALVATNATGTASGLSIGGNAATATLASTVTTNANLTGAVTSTGNATLLGSFSSANLLTALSDKQGSGLNVFATSPTLTTPVLGAATATSINGNIFTTGTYTLTGTAGKTLNFTNTLTLSGTDSTTMTFPSTSATIARTDAANTFTGAQTYSNAVIYTNNAITASGNAATVPVTATINTVTNNSAATLTITMTTASAVNRQISEVLILDASAVAQTITWVNTEDSTVTAPTTSNGSTTLPLSVLFQFNTGTSKWRTIAKA